MLRPSHAHFSAKTYAFSRVGSNIAKPAFWTPPKRVSFGTLHHILRYGVTLTGGVSYLFLNDISHRMLPGGPRRDCKRYALPAEAILEDSDQRQQAAGEACRSSGVVSAQEATRERARSAPGTPRERLRVSRSALGAPQDHPRSAPGSERKNKLVKRRSDLKKTRKSSIQFSPHPYFRRSGVRRTPIFVDPGLARFFFVA